MSNRKHPTQIEKSIPDEKDLLLPGVKKKVEAASSSRNEVSIRLL